MQIPEPEETIESRIYEHYKRRQGGPRLHLGASILGHKCDRKIWLEFRWAVQEKFKGRILRLFERGQREESWIVEDLRAIGIDVQHTGDQQARVEFGCHVSGSMDGICLSGVIGAPKTAHILEIKTHNKKSFDSLIKDGVKKSKLQHWIQMQCYMLGSKIDRALYIAVGKDDDRIYSERVRYDKEAAQKAIARGHRIALANRMPEPISASPTWYECRLCACHGICHDGEKTEHVNCRTCAYSHPVQDGTWHCQVWQTTIPAESQITGCDRYSIHRDLGEMK